MSVSLAARPDREDDLPTGVGERQARTSGAVKADKAVFRRYNFCKNLPKPKASSGTESTDEYATAEKYDLQDVEEDIKERNESSNGDGVFIPGAWPMAETLVQLSQLGNNKVGLTDKEVKDRYRAVGMNTIEMTKPSFIKQLGLEFSRPFYTYQMFLIWSWFPLYYYYMAIVIGFMVTSSAFVVALFHYNNLSNLYKITHIKGYPMFCAMECGLWWIKGICYLEIWSRWTRV